MEKEGKVSYMLGTVHIGVSLYELPCSDIIFKKLVESDLVFVEIVNNSEHEREGREQEGSELLSSNGEDFKQLSVYSQYFLREKGVPSDLNCMGLNIAVESLCIMETMGASHFIDAFNLIDMLESKGFSVERISCQ